MKTSFKRFAALALAAVMVLGTMNLAAFADTGNRTLDSALVISGLNKGDVVRFYQVLEENEDTADMTGWVYTDNFITMSSDYETPVSAMTGYPARNPSVPMGITAERAGHIARLVATENATPNYTVTVTGDKAEVQNPVAGLYVAIITSSDPNTVYNPVFVGADFVVAADHNGPNSSAFQVVTSARSYSNNAAAKKSTLTIKKSAKTTEDAWDDKSEYTTAIGDSVSFTVDTTIPGFGKVYIDPKFELEDTMQNLDLQFETVKVYEVIGGAETPLAQAANTYTLSETANGYKIVFAKDYLTGLVAPRDIRVKYDAKVNTDAAKNLTVEENKVEITYSTNPTHSKDGIPTSPGDFQKKKDITNHYTFTIDAGALFGSDELIGKSGSEFVKIGVDAAGNRINSVTTSSDVTKGNKQEGALQGATFRLYTGTPCTDANEYKPKNAQGVEQSPVLYTTGADGKFTITGLDAGTYYLKEISAPAGFIKHQDPVEIKITAVIEHPTITEWFFNGEWHPTIEAAKTAADTFIRTYGLAGAEDNAAFYDEFIRKWEYDTDVLKSYSIQIDGQPKTTHTFMHESHSSEIKWSKSESVEVPASIPNTQGVELPSTGGVGTTIFYAGGAMLVLLAGILLVSKRRIA